MTTAALANAAPKYLQKAIDKLKTFGLTIQEPNSRPITAIISRIAQVDETRALTIARTLSQQEVFDGLVADQISQMNVSNRFELITAGFDSIREDSQRLVSQAEKASPSLGDRVGNIYMKVTRGDISDRFDEIKKIYNEVVIDVQTQVDKERNILDAYADFRGSIKEAEVLAHEIKETITKDLEAAKEALTDAQAAVDGAGDASAADKARLELARDEAARAHKDVDDRFQIAKDLAENLTVSYSVTEITMAKLAQSHAAKDRIFKQSVMFFATNSSVLSALKATYTGVLGLNEATKTLDAMQEGIAKSLESIADIGTQASEAALRKGYGPSIRADAVKKLVDSVVSYQENSIKTIEEMRILSTKNAEEIRDNVEAGKKRIAKLTAGGIAI